MAYASRQVAYPPPILEISSNTAVARATDARDAARAVVALRDWVDAVALRTTLDDAARDVFTAERAATSDDDTTVFVRVALRGVTAPAMARDVPDARCVVAARDTTPDDTPDVPDAVRVAPRVSVRTAATPVAPRGFGAWSAFAPPTQNTVAITKQDLVKIFLRMVIRLVLSLVCIVSFSHGVNQYRIYSMQQFTAFFTQSPNLRTADFDSAVAAGACLAFFPLSGVAAFNEHWAVAPS